MTLEEALAYLTPHPMTGDGACIGLTAGKMREAVAVIEAELERYARFWFQEHYGIPASAWKRKNESA